MLRLVSQYDGRRTTFPLCSFDAPWQKLTSLLYSPGFARWMEPLNALRCAHTSHARLAGGTVGVDGVPSAETSAYPPGFHYYIAARRSQAYTPRVRRLSYLPPTLPLPLRSPTPPNRLTPTRRQPRSSHSPLHRLLSCSPFRHARRLSPRTPHHLMLTRRARCANRSCLPAVPPTASRAHRLAPLGPPAPPMVG